MHAEDVAATSCWVLRLVVAVSLLTTVGCGRASDDVASATTYHAGYVLREQTPELSHAFELKNTSRRTTTIKKVSKSCSCAQVSVDRMVVEPGESALVTVVVDVPEVLVKKVAACTIETDDPLKNAFQYTVEFTSLPTGLVEPSEIAVDRSEFANAESVVKSVKLLSFDRLGSEDFESVLASGVPGIDVSSVGKSDEEDLGNRIAKRSRIVKLRISKKADEVHAASRTVLSFSAPAARFRANLPILFRDPGDVNVYPSVVNFGVLSVAGGSTRFVTLRLKAGAGSVDDVRLESDSDALQPVLTPLEHGAARVCLRLNHTRLRSNERGAAIALAGVIRVRLRGNVAATVPWAALVR
jgi:hypothetical protein